MLDMQQCTPRNNGMTQGLLCRNETKGNPILKTNASSKLGHTVYGLNFSPHWPLSQMSLCSELPAQPRITDLLGSSYPWFSSQATY